MVEKSRNLPLTKNSSVLFVTFSRWAGGKRTPTNGSLDPIREYLVPRIRKLVIIDQPHPGSDRVMPVIEEFLHNKKTPKTYSSSLYLYVLKPLLLFFNKSSTQPLFKIRDFLSVIDWSLKNKTIYDYCICLESINTIAAIFLKRVGKVKVVVYYVSDYSPQRYRIKMVNDIYLWLDRFAATHADYIWDVSLAMQPARISAGLNPKKSAPVIHVPNGLKPSQIKANPVSKIDKYAMVFMGTLGSENGPDIAIQALYIAKKTFPEAKLHIIGGSYEDSLWLRKLVKKKKLEKNVIFHGFVSSGVEMSKIIRGTAIGLAPYRAIPGSIRWYADAGKIRTYCASGLPVISSHVPPLGQQAKEKGAALIVKDNPKEFSDAIVKLFKDKDLYLRLRKSAIIFAKHSTWENTFTKAFSEIK